MKKVQYFLLFCCVAWIFNFNSYAKTELYTTNKIDGAWGIESFNELMNQLLEKNDDIIFFIHGRGKHPVKGVKLLPEIEQRYGAKVVMFHWKSWTNAVSRPVKAAKEAALDLQQVLYALQSYKKNNPAKMLRLHLSLLVHSMGNLVMEEFIQKYYTGDLVDGLFDNILLNASDTGAEQHAEWANKINFKNQLFITLNKQDGILHGSILIDFKDGKYNGPRLGRKIRSNGGRYFTLSNNSIYVDISKQVGLKHRHYLLPDDAKHDPINKLVFDMLIEDEFDYKDYLGLAPAKFNGEVQSNYYYFK